MLVGDSTMLGSRQAIAYCALRSLVRRVFQYEPVNVEISTYRRIEVAPGTTVRGGTTLDVTPVGRCPFPIISQASVTFQSRLGDRGTFQPTYGTITGHPDGSWTARMFVPADTSPGPYELVATCVYSRSYTTFYPVVPITVVGSR